MRRLLLFVVLAAACGGDTVPLGDGVSGHVRIDGSSTVFIIAEAVAEEFQIRNPAARVTVGISGTGGGFQRFCAGETDLETASRAITPDEAERCRENGVEYHALPVARDGISIVVNPANDFAGCLTVEELRLLWEPGSTVRTWQDIRTTYPPEEIRLYGAGPDSGTFDYFTQEIVGTLRASRTDYQASEDDNVLVQGVAGDPYALGYFGYAYYLENRDRVKLLEVDGGAGCVAPSPESIRSGAYTPLTRPLFVYLSRASLRKPVVDAFVRFLLDQADTLIPPTGYQVLEPEEYDQIREDYAALQGS